MLAKTPLIDLALDWVGRQNPEQSYNWSDSSKCGCAQLASFLGCEEAWSKRQCDDDWASLNVIARGPLTDTKSVDPTQHTFGLFYERLKLAAVSFV